MHDIDAGKTGNWKNGDVRNVICPATKTCLAPMMQEELKKDLSSAKEVHEQIILKRKSGKGFRKTQWIRFGRFFDCNHLDKLPEEVPFACIAMPLDGASEGLAFAHLPLPLKTGQAE